MRRHRQNLERPRLHWHKCSCRRGHPPVAQTLKRPLWLQTLPPKLLRLLSLLRISSRDPPFGSFDSPGFLSPRWAFERHSSRTWQFTSKRYDAERNANRCSRTHYERHAAPPAKLRNPSRLRNPASRFTPSFTQSPASISRRRSVVALPNLHLEVFASVTTAVDCDVAE